MSSFGSAQPASGQTQANAAKPSLTGVRIKQRKGQAKAAAKFEPEVFRDALLAYFSTLPKSATPEQVLSKLILAGSQLELLKYSDAFFELFFCGGLLQPGGGYLDAGSVSSNNNSDGASESGTGGKRSNVAILRTRGTGLGDADTGDEEFGGAGQEGVAEGDWKKEVRELVDVLKKMTQRYKYMQKPLEETSLSSLIAYIPKWSRSMREKLAYATAYLVVEGLVTAKCLQSLWRDGVTKDEIALQFMTDFIKAYTTPPASQSLEGFATLFRKSQLDNLGFLNILPSQTRNQAHLESHFKKEGLQGVVDWYVGGQKKKVGAEIGARLAEMFREEDSIEEMIEYLKNQQSESKTPETDMLQYIWNAIMANVDWTSKPEQLEGLATKNIKTYAPLLEPFCTSPKAEVGLINIVQVYCYTETRIIKAFPLILKLLYNGDCISDQAIIYWAQKGAVAQGKGHFLKAAEPLVKHLQEEDEDDDDEE